MGDEKLRHVPFLAEVITLDAKLRFSIKPAYAFGVEHGLGPEVDEIRDMEIEWDLAYNTSVRKGYLLELFERRDF